MINSTQCLEWCKLEPELDRVTTLFEQTDTIKTDAFSVLQQRLEQTIQMWCASTSTASPMQFLLLNAEETTLQLSFIADIVKRHSPDHRQELGWSYHINQHDISLLPARSKHDPFVATQRCAYRDWIECEQLFGRFRQYQGEYSLQPGLVHQVNGGVLILSLRSLLMQPLLWFRLKNMVVNQQYEWFSHDESQSLPIHIPSMPLHLKVILVGDRVSLDEFQQLDPAIYKHAMYGEFESHLFNLTDEKKVAWFAYLKNLAKKQHLPPLDPSIASSLIRCAVRETEDQNTLPMSCDWVQSILTQTAYFAQKSGENILGKVALEQAIEHKRWREGYLPEQVLNDLEQGLVHIDTKGAVIGQINGLSVVEFPGHPRAFGEPSRISCVVYSGDGDIIDIERKAELAGEIHSKGMMIMQSFISSEIAFHHPLPFSASIVFEQSYTEVDGDSASLAGLCALISALSLQPITQQLAVTGSVDQFGRVQAIGGINEKIEGFYALCQRRGLTSKQGVIIPTANVRHLCLHDDVIHAVKENQFHIFHVAHVSQALSLLTDCPYQSDESSDKPGLRDLMLERIHMMSSFDKPELPWFLRWMRR